ncbi:MAG: rhodanese-like domain-containing protein [Acidimicrobiia bacterium]
MTPPPRPRRLLLLAAGAALVVGLAACGSDAPSDHDASSPETASEEKASMAGFDRLDPEQFATRMGNADATVINVHIPYEGELADTDAFIQFDSILGDAKLPADKDGELLLYCMSGRMSEAAANDLIAEGGYTNVSHLEGGMKAWEATGRTLIRNPDHQM